MSSLNKVMLIGNVGNDPEVRHSQEGLAFASFSLATNEYSRDKITGETKIKTDWHRIRAIGSLAETCRKHLKKGARIYLEGTLTYSSYEKDGHKFKTTDILMKNMAFLDSKATTEEQEQADNALLEDTLPDDIPF